MPHALGGSFPEENSLWLKGRAGVAGRRGSSGPSKGEGKPSTKGQNCLPKMLGTAFQWDPGPVSLPGGYCGFYRKPLRGWSLCLLFSTLSSPLHPAAPSLTSLCEACSPVLAFFQLRHFSLLQVLPAHPPPAGRFSPTCSVSCTWEALLPCEDTSLPIPKRRSQGLGLDTCSPLLSCRCLVTVPLRSSL